MKYKSPSNNNIGQEINLKMLFEKVLKYKWLFVLSIVLCLSIALAYIKMSTPIYEASTSILIDPKGSNRVLGNSRYVDGGVDLYEMEKNLYNEIGIIKSFSLIKQTVRNLNFDVSYYSGNWPMIKERYGYFPFEVSRMKNKAQIFGVPFVVKLLPKDQYRLSVEAKDFSVLNPSNGTMRQVNRDFKFSEVFTFGEKVEHDYFNFIIEKPDYEVSEKDFKEEKLSFIIQSLDGVASGYASKLSVDNIDLQASIFKIISSGPLVAKEVDFLKQLTKNYVQNKIRSRSRAAANKEDFIRNQLKIVSDSLARVEGDLEVFKRDKRALDLGATATNALGQTSKLQVEQAKIEMNINYYNSLIQDIQENRTSDEFVIPTAVGIEDPLINSNILELKNLYAVRSRKKFYVTGTNEEMNILNSQIEESTDLLLSNLRNAIQSAQYSLRGIESQLSRFSGVISSLPARENQLLNIERQTTLYENLFNYLSQELAKTGIAGAESMSDTKILDEPRMLGYGPVKPKKKMLLSMAALIGILIPLAGVALFSPNNTIENVDDITANSDLPIIASISYYDTKSKKKNSSLALWNLKESFRFLTANLKLFGKANQNVLAITSVMPGEGKSFTSVNLAVTMAESGKKTLLIDTDLRSPSVVDEMHKVEGKGLSNYLMGDIEDYKDIIYPHETLKDLNFIPTAVVQTNIQYLLAGTKMKSLILELKKQYDYVILDTPAVGIVSDLLLFWEVIDINLFVIRRNVSKMSFLEDIANLIPEDKKKKSGIIFNNAEGKAQKYGYGQKYGQNEESQVVMESLTV